MIQLVVTSNSVMIVMVATVVFVLNGQRKGKVIPALHYIMLLIIYCTVVHKCSYM